MNARIPFLKFVLFVSVLWCFTGATVLAQTYFVSTSGNDNWAGTAAGTPFATISHAISVAADGDIIEVADGTYTEDLVVNTPNLTLVSENGSGSTTIQLVGSGNPSSPSVGINLQAGATNFILGTLGHGFNIKTSTSTSFLVQLENAPSGVTIQDNTLDAIGKASMGISVGAAGASNLTVSNNTFSCDVGDGAIWGPTVTDVDVSNNTFNDPGSSASGYAVQFSGVAAGTISGNTITGYGSGIFLYGIAADVDGVIIDQNTITGCAKGIRLGHSSMTMDVKNLSITQNTLASNTIGIYMQEQDGVGDFAGTIDINNNSITGSGTQFDNTTTFVPDATFNWWGTTDEATIQGYISGTIDYSPWWGADYVGITHTTSWTFYTNDVIQDAIDAATDAGDIINVLAGTYTEDLSIPIGKDDLEISGAGLATTTIVGVSYNGIGQVPNINILSSGVKLHDFKIKNPAYSALKSSSGIIIGAANVVIYNNAFEVAGAESDAEISQAIQTWNKLAIPGTDISGLNIHDNTFTDQATSTWGYEGIYVNRDEGTSLVTIADNIFTGDIFRAITTERSKTTISGNSITTDLDPSNDIFSTAGGWEGINVRSASDASAITDVTVSGNTVTGNSGFNKGIRIGKTGESLTSISVTGNTVSKNKYGILVIDFAEGVTISGNYIINNTTYGVKNEDTGVSLNAENNWWGSPLGPNMDLNPKIGAVVHSNPVSADVDFDPWVGKTTPPAKAVISWPTGNAVVYTANPLLQWYFVPNPPPTATGVYDVYIKKSTESVYKDVSEATLPNFVATPGLTTTSSNAAGMMSLTPNATYDFKVRTYFDDGTFTDSDEESFTVDNSQGGAIIPIVSWPVGGATVYSTTPQLNWYLNSGSSGLTYQVEYSTSSTTGAGGFFDTPAGTLPLTPDLNTSDFPSALTAGDTYFWHVRSKNVADLYSAWSTTAEFKVNSAASGGAVVPVPSWPVSSATVYTNPPTLYWYILSQATGLHYKVQYSTASDFSVSPVTESSTTNQSLTLSSGLTAGETYYWHVASSTDDITYTTYSSTATFKMWENAGGGGGGSVAVPIPSWPVNNATMYSNPPTMNWYLNSSSTGLKFEVEYSKASNFTSSPAITEDLTINLSKTLTASLDPGETYYWHVRSTADDGGTFSAFSSTASFVMLGGGGGGGGALPTPVTSWPNGGTTVYSLTQTLNWYITSYVPGSVSYEVQFAAVGVTFVNDATPAPITVSSGTSYEITDLAYSTSYHWRVRLKSETLYSDWSSEASFTTVSSLGYAAAPMLGDPIEGIEISASKVSLGWFLPTAPAGGQSYRVELSKNADMSSPFVSYDNIFAFNQEVSSLSAGTYYWRVLSTTDDGKSSSYSNTGMFKITGVTAVDNETNVIPETFTVSQNYPNPFNPSTIIKFGLPEASFVSIKIYNILGQEVKNLLSDQKNAGTYSVQWNGDNNFGYKVSSGTYIYRIVAGANVSTKKMILMK